MRVKLCFIYIVTITTIKNLIISVNFEMDVSFRLTYFLDILLVSSKSDTNGYFLNYIDDEGRS